MGKSAADRASYRELMIRSTACGDLRRGCVSVFFVGGEFGLRWPLAAGFPVFHRSSEVSAMEGPVRLEGMTAEQFAEAKRELEEAASRGAAAG